MEGWLYGLFAILGALVGSLFPYLGIKKQLRQQREMDSHQWRRKVRSEPLLKLRDSLALMATRLHILVTNTQLPRGQSDITQEVENKKSQRALDDWRDYMTSGDFLLTLNLQYDTELIKLVKDIESSYMVLFEYALDYKNLKPNGLKDFREISRSIENKVPEVQEVIYKRLQEL